MLVVVRSDTVTDDFERAFAAIVGEGQGIAYASGRMGFYALLSAMGVKPGDEVVLPGFTCAVMANAVLKTGATPIFCDIDSSNFGTDAASVQRVLSSRTRVVVAQHSFGYACDVDAVMEAARTVGAAVIEDCATTLGTKVGNRMVGDIGDAALFSLDHSKPLNTLVGGVIYSRNRELTATLRSQQRALPELPETKQRAIWSRLMQESLWANPDQQWRLGLVDAFSAVKRRLGAGRSGFLDEDYLPDVTASSYPYLARFPSFLAQIGIAEVRNWANVRQARVAAMQAVLSIVRSSPSGNYLPRVLDDANQEIVPLRLAWSEPAGSAVRRRIDDFVATEGTWFMQPLVATPRPAEDFGYQWGSCPTAESLQSGMVNLPILSDLRQMERLVGLLSRTL